jgi:hypothetical protein
MPSVNWTHDAEGNHLAEAGGKKLLIRRHFVVNGVEQPPGTAAHGNGTVEWTGEIDGAEVEGLREQNSNAVASVLEAAAAEAAPAAGST